MRAAESEQDATIFLTAAFTGLRRGELVALRWRSVDFAHRSIRVVASYSERALSTPKSGKARSVPMAPPVAEALARLASRGHDDHEDDLVFPGTFGEYGTSATTRSPTSMPNMTGAVRRLQSTALCSPGTFRRELSDWSAGGLTYTTMSCWRTGGALDDINQSRRSTLSPNIESWSQFPHSSTSRASR